MGSVSLGKLVGKLSRLCISHDDVHNQVHNIIRQMTKDNYCPDHVLGITRGGLFPAVMLSCYYNVPMSCITVSYYSKKINQEQLSFHAQNAKNLLLVDDGADSGQTIRHVLQKLSNNVRVAVLMNNTANQNKRVDYRGMDMDIPFKSLPRQKHDIPFLLVMPWEAWWEN